MERLRTEALITYSDFETCVKILAKWKENNPAGGFICQAEVERMALEAGYPARISRRSYLRAIAESGFVQTREFDRNTNKSVKSWKWEPCAEPTPF
jgi:hypothetical protein